MSLTSEDAARQLSLPGETLIFVYGSLLRGLRNHHRLQQPGVRYLGTAVTANGGYYMAGLGFPILRSSLPPHKEASDGYAVKGEVFAVPPPVLASLDQLESHPDAYVRTLIDVHLNLESEAASTGESSSVAAGAGAAAGAAGAASTAATTTPLTIQASVYFSDVFWTLEGDAAFDSLYVPNGDFRAFLASTNETGWKEGGKAPHPLPIDEPLVVVRSDSAGSASASEGGERSQTTLEWLEATPGTRRLGACVLHDEEEDEEEDGEEDGEGKAAGGKKTMHIYFVPPSKLCLLDVVRGHKPGAVVPEGAGEPTGSRRIPVRVRVVAGGGEAGRGAAAHPSRGEAPLDWVPGGDLNPGDVTHAFAYV